MHDRLPLTSDGFAAIFRAAEAWKISVSVVFARASARTVKRGRRKTCMLRGL